MAGLFERLVFRPELFCILLAVCGAGATQVQAAEFFAAPGGTGDGTADRPASLAAALNNKQIQPGDTLFLRGGTYRGTFTSKLAGTPFAPILVRPYRHERVIIDGSLADRIVKNVTALEIEGAHTYFEDLEITNSDPERELKVSGSNPPGRRGSAVFVLAPGIKLINSVIHDAGNGVSAYGPAIDFESYGNLIFNNGWKAPDRGHGHGVYTQNDTGVKLYRENVILHQFGNAMNLYGSAAARLRNFRFTGNALFFGRLLFGGGSALENVVLEQNMTYGAGIEFGYGDTINNSVFLRNNYLAAGVTFLNMKNVSMSGNTVLYHARTNGTRCVGITPPAEGTYNASLYLIDRNDYTQCTQNGFDFRFPGKLYTFRQWQELGFDRSSTYTPLPNVNARPPGVKTFLRRNQYDAGRAMLVVYNWELAGDVTVDMTGFLESGDGYELRNAQDYFSDIVTGTYEGTALKVPMTGHTVAVPGGASKAIGSSTFPQAGIFLVRRLRALPAPAPRIDAILNGASRTSEPIAPGSFVVFSGSNLGPAERIDATPVAGVIPGILAGVRVKFDGAAASVLYASASELGVLVPAAVRDRSVSEIRVEYADQTSDSAAVPAAAASPALFTLDGSGSGQANALNEDGSINGAGSPAAAGAQIALVATGLGIAQSPLAEGAIARQPFAPALPVKVRVGEVTVDPEFVPGTGEPALGAAWMRIRIPSDTPPGNIPVFVSAGDRISIAPVTIAVR